MLNKLKTLLSLLLITNACSIDNKKYDAAIIIKPSYTKAPVDILQPVGTEYPVVKDDIDLCFYPEGSFELTYTIVGSTCDDVTFISSNTTVQTLNTNEPVILPMDCITAIDKPTVQYIKGRNTCETLTNITCKLEGETYNFSINLEMLTDLQVGGTYTIDIVSDTSSCSYYWEVVGKQINPSILE